MILIALGSNLPSPYGSPLQTVQAALARFPDHALQVEKMSAFYRTAPVPVSDQPWYVNAVAAVQTSLAAPEILATLLAIEQQFGRVRGDPDFGRHAARTLDLDVLDVNGLVLNEAGLQLPHPRLHERAFVLYPLRDVAQNWQHPVTGQSIDTLIAALPPGQGIEKMA